MKKISVLMILIVVLVLMSSLFMSPASADKNRKSDPKVTRRTSKSLAASGSSDRDAEKTSAREANGAGLLSKGEDSENFDEQDPDMPKIAGGIDKEEFLRLRDEYIARRRGVEPGRPGDPLARGRAIRQMERQESRMRSAAQGSSSPDATLAAWVPLGPGPLPNGSAQGGTSIAVSGRATAVVVDPTNSNKVYLGTAQGGVWRSLDGGASWASIFDNAQSQAIGALALAPSNPTILYVGTGEFHQCGDCFFGVGLYRIDNADTAATLVGPINPSQTISNFTYNIFNGRGISRILVHPSDPATIFVSTGRGIGGSGANSLGLVPTIATRGVYRSTNATAAAGSVTFQKIVVTTDNSPDAPGTGNVDTPDMALEPGNPNNLLVSVIGISNPSGIFRTTNALAATPTFTQTLSLPTGTRANLAINKVGPVVTVYAASSETPAAPATCTTGTNSGALRKSIDGGVTWTPQLTGGGGFCGTQCFYDLAVAIDPNDANLVYLGGNARGTCSDAMKKSTDGGATFTRDDNALHADSHSLFFDTSTSPSTIYATNDGGVWKRASTAAAGSAWTNLNNAPLNTLQFQSVAVHPLDRNFTMGGTQDNGTEVQQTTPGNWISAEGGDGGYALIDQGATNTTNVTMYHTFFNATGSQIGFDRIINTSCLAIKNSWPTRGDFGVADQLSLACDGTPDLLNNGISRTDNVLFYAPMALGPGTPNTVYFGSDRLYRSTDRGDHMSVVSQTPISGTSPASTIAISPQDDNYRVVGMQNGQVWATSTGSATLVNLTSGSFPANPNGSTTNKFVGRAIIDPNNKNVAYVTFSFFAPAGQGVWRINNLGAAAGSSPAVASWAAVASGIPSVPINAFAVDPLNSNHLYAGTDIGVYFSADAGASWNPYGTGLPRSAVFDLAIQNPNRLIRIATHGRGMWETPAVQGGSQIQLSSSTYNVGEGDGKVIITATRSGDTSGTSSVDFATSNGTASQRTDYIVRTGTMTFTAGVTSRSFSVPIIDDAYAEPSETINITLSNAVNAAQADPSTAVITILDNDAAGPSLAQKRFGASFGGAEETPPNASTGSGQGYVLLNGAETSANVSLQFMNLSSAESGAHIHSAPAGVPGSIIFPLPTTNPVTDTVINPTMQQVADLKASLHYMNIHSNNFPGGEIRGQLLWNPTMEGAFFVRQHYLDFLGRDPDAAGLSFWIDRLNLNCTSGAQCFHDNTIGVSDAFFFEPEFHLTAGFVFLVYRAAYGNTQPFPNPDASNVTEANKLPDYTVFTSDRARVVGGATLPAAQLAFANLLVTRAEFTSRYGAGLNTGALFVDAILAAIQANDSVNLTSQRQALIDQYNTAGGGNAGRGQVMYLLGLDDAANNPINNRAFVNAEYNRQFALTLYFGYLRRNPDIGGFLFWQSQINSAPVGDVPKQQALVCSFVSAPEYQLRFGPNTPRNNRECPQ